ncbi:MAG: hypothetical protein R6U61_04535 [Thermoplasmata archaeon]
MASPVLEIIGGIVLSVLALLAFIKILFSARARKQVWDAFEGTEENSGLERREGLGISYGMPDLVGNIDGRKVYIHPVRGKKGKRARLSKTVYAVESQIDLGGDIVISSPETIEDDENLEGLDVPRLKKYGLAVSSESIESREAVKRLITKDAANKIHRLKVKNGEDFGGLILEPGIMMFSKFNIDVDEVKMRETLQEMVRLISSMEDDRPDLNEDIKNKRLKEVEKVSKTVHADIAIMFGIAALSVYFIYDHPSLLFLNLGVVLLGLSVSRVFSIVYTRGWLES